MLKRWLQIVADIGRALWNLANRPAVMYAKSMGLWSRSTWGFACLLAYTNGMG